LTRLLPFFSVTSGFQIPHPVPSAPNRSGFISGNQELHLRRPIDHSPRFAAETKAIAGH
jgi:hypothetical protein